MIFVDTGAFLARYVEGDQYHQIAVRAWKRLERTSGALFTSSYVVDETLTLLGRRTSYAFAAARADAIYASRVLTILRPDASDESAAVDLFRKFADQKVSFTDCVSFALMRRHRLKKAFTFDRHFAGAGFEIWPTSVRA
ncbi:MAG TPA: PIN domain-containing protein [Thermoanaerobaculia bacterium]|nr:PIN domain-containing protein [Thermoanaerobaculia bacterium]